MSYNEFKKSVYKQVMCVCLSIGEPACLLVNFCEDKTTPQILSTFCVYVFAINIARPLVYLHLFFVICSLSNLKSLHQWQQVAVNIGFFFRKSKVDFVTTCLHLRQHYNVIYKRITFNHYFNKILL